MLFSIPVFDEVEAKMKRGAEAEEMLTCPACGEVKGVLVCPIRRMEHHDCNIDDVIFDVLVWERWRCLDCGNVWIERYGIGERVQGDNGTVQGSKMEKFSMKTALEGGYLSGGMKHETAMEGVG